MSDIWGRKSLKDWQYDKKRVKGCTRKNVEVLREFKEVNAELGRVGTLTYFLLTRFSEFNSGAMMHSARRQRNLVQAIMKELKTYRLDPPWDKIFEREINKIRNRSDHCYMICKENLRLTKHWPYFERVGFEHLLDFEQFYDEEHNTSVLDKVIPEMEKWEDEHEEDIEMYMESISDELKRHEAWKEKKLESIKVSKETARKEKARIRAEEKQEKEWEKERISQRKKENADLNCIINRNQYSEYLLHKDA